ncbi:uncharacterized protein DUF4403 [Fluviicoccus keumensis]|uniref:Uncharacterized protein DUF4403 n=1 Tax=Fluviicoccus keumensis TaxID=1435465 RepID=A0A4Q7ZBT4_9GAMM|nr:DUF4403 family protein [Fluviicoccus keumensis]RZU47443.1 uncharacterized protein DUF4403 [Fluviicoccus keumensis]
MRTVWPALAVSAALLVGCSAPQIQPPPNSPLPFVMPAVNPSVINLPISLDLEALRAEVLRTSPKPLSYATTTQPIGIGNADIQHKVFLKDLKLSVTGNQFQATTQLDFSLDSNIRAAGLNLGGVSCGINGEEMPRIEFTLPGKLYWTQGGDLALQSDPWQLKWLKPCNITKLNLPVEKILNLPIVRDKVQTLVTAAITDNLKQFGLKAMLGKAWPTLNEPRELQKNVWLLLQPESVGLADIKGNGRLVTTAVSVQARPQIVTGDKPRLPLPPQPQPQRLTSTPDTFFIALRGDIGLDTANALLNEKLVGKPFDAGGREVLIESLRFYGSGDKAVLGLKLQKPIAAEVYLLGKPVLDTDTNEMRLEDVTFELSTSSFLARSANWMLHGTFRDAIQEKARFNFDKDLADVLKDFRDYRQDLGYGMNLRLQVASVKPQGVFFTPTELKALVLVDGKLGIDSGKPAIPVAPPAALPAAAAPAIKPVAVSN